MIIKKFIAPTMNEALRQVRAELGEEAVILQSRKIEKKGALSLKKHVMFEVTASTPDRYPAPPKEKVNFDDSIKEALARAADKLRETSEETKDVTKSAGKPGSKEAKGLSQHFTKTSETGPPENSNIEGGLKSDNYSVVDHLQNDLHELKNRVADLASKVATGTKNDIPRLLRNELNNLMENGTSEAIATEIIEQCAASEIENKHNPEIVHAYFLKTLEERFKIRSIAKSAKVIAMIGPTGVGKTTTVAKLATNRKIFGNDRVVLISTDTYRVAAVEQLKTFASIAGLPIEVIYRPEELRDVIEKYKDRDRILIDTAGRSLNDQDAISELGVFIEHAEPDEVLLGLSAGNRLEDQKQILKKFSVAPISGIILTKIDEISSGGHLLDLADVLPLDWIYMTTGQNVPDDIMATDRGLLAELAGSRARFDNLRLENFDY
ncbi:flagellar biosynthesis protein FlhF [bacterium]|nr:flagellar biosynthesis protein FlhF [bacterium]